MRERAGWHTRSRKSFWSTWLQWAVVDFPLVLVVSASMLKWFWGLVLVKNSLKMGWENAGQHGSSQNIMRVSECTGPHLLIWPPKAQMDKAKKAPWGKGQGIWFCWGSEEEGDMDEDENKDREISNGNDRSYSKSGNHFMMWLSHWPILAWSWLFKLITPWRSFNIQFLTFYSSFGKPWPK